MTAETLRTWASDLLRTRSWHELQPFAVSYAARGTILLSAVGYFLLLNRQALDWAELAPTFRLFWPGTPWRVVTTYYGLVLLALSTVIFRVRCPRALQRQPTLSGFLETAVPATMQNAERITRALEEVSAKLDKRPASQEPLPDEATFRRLTAAGHGSDNAETIMAVDACMSLEWRLQNTEFPLSRFACTVFMLLGGAILALPALATFIEITAWSMQLLAG